MDRIENALRSKIYHGIIDWYLHRSLLWRRTTGTQEQKRIEYPSDRSIPSWSWMAYPGGISFEADDCEWGNLDVIKDIEVAKVGVENNKLGNAALQTLVWKFAGSDARIKRRGDTDMQVLDSKGFQGWISLDIKVELLRVPDLVVLARLKESRVDGTLYFVLFVERQESGNYERLGIGMIREGCELASLGRHHIV